MNELARKVRLHARTCRMMGVDFLPARPHHAAVLEHQPPNAISEGLSRPTASQMETKPAWGRQTETRVAPRAATPQRQSSTSAPSAVRGSTAETFLPTGPSRSVASSSDPSAGAAALEADEVVFSPIAKVNADQAQAWLDRTLQRYEQDSPHSRFKTDHHSIVFGEGDPGARLMFIGEAPGAEEDKVGRPFVGRAGQLLDKMIVAMGLQRESVYITNVLKTRPPNNATPTFDEAAACAPYLFEQIAIIRPEAIVTLGLPATRLLLHTAEAMSRLRGRWAAFTIPTALPHPDTLPAISPAVVPVMPTFHPAFLLRSYTPENRQKVWSDLLMVLDRLGIARPKPSATK